MEAFDTSAEQPAEITDPVRFEVIRSALQAFTEEMGAALARSAYSTNIKTRLDFSCCFFDRDAKMVAQGTANPSHLGSMVFSVPLVLKEYGVERLEPGDGILINDSHRGMVHLNDIMLVSPLHYRGEVVGYVANIAHHVDVGGRAPGSIAVTTETYQEGIIIPGVKVLSRGEINEELFKLINANVRGKKESAGDFRAQIAANKLGMRRMVELIDKFGLDSIYATIKQLYTYTERRVRREFDKLPAGEYFGDAYVDDDGLTDKPIKIQARIAIGNGDVLIDLTGTDKQVEGPMNSTYAQTYSGVAYPLKALLPTDIPINDGFYRMVKLIAPKGTVVNCDFPAAVVGGWEVAQKTTEAVFRAFSKAMPERVAGETKKTILHIAFGGVDPRSGENYVFLETMAGGFGGRSMKDGPDAVQSHHQNTENSPVEELEVGYPVLILQYHLLPDTEGAGKYRGGLGLRRDYRFRDHVATVTILADTVKFPPRGTCGGFEARPARYLMNPNSPKVLGSKSTFRVTPQDVVSIQTPGGGGYGEPFKRDLEAVLDDVRNGKVSLERARSVYGVQIDAASWKIDHYATQKLRAAA